MFAIQAEDNILEEVVVLPTLAADDVAAMTVMTAKAELWANAQPGFTVDSFTIHQDFHMNSVTVMHGDTAVYELTAWPINHVVDSAELATFIKPKGDRRLN